MERWQKYAVVGLSITILGLSAFTVGYRVAGGGPDGPVSFLGDNQAEGLDLVDDAFTKIRSSSVNPPSEKELARSAVKGMVKALKKANDPYASFYSPSGYQAFQQYTNGRFSGIGVWLKKKAGELEIVSVLPSTPALQAGLRSGDIILSVDNVAVDSLSVDEAVARIKGPVGSKVALEIGRGSETIHLDLTRESIDLPNLVSRVEEGDLGYIRLFGFADGAGEQVRQKVQALTTGGADGLILDLRDNGGGLFSEAIDVASVFIEDGDIVTYKEASKPDVVFGAEGEAYEDVPLVVLVNEGTASASEIVAGALQDRDRAILVGNETYGKGSVQEVVPLADASAVKLTTGAYLTPSGKSINGKGIEPDVEVQGDPEEQQQRAEDILRGIVVSSTGAQG
jgi:carboxyl-terminal processing protease